MKLRNRVKRNFNYEITTTLPVKITKVDTNSWSLPLGRLNDRWITSVRRDACVGHYRCTHKHRNERAPAFVMSLMPTMESEVLLYDPFASERRKSHSSRAYPQGPDFSGPEFWINGLPKRPAEPVGFRVYTGKQLKSDSKRAVIVSVAVQKR